MYLNMVKGSQIGGNYRQINYKRFSPSKQLFIFYTYPRMDGGRQMLSSSLLYVHSGPWYFSMICMLLLQVTEGRVNNLWIKDLWAIHTLFASRSFVTCIFFSILKIVNQLSLIQILCQILSCRLLQVSLVLVIYLTPKPSLSVISYSLFSTAPIL